MNNPTPFSVTLRNLAESDFPILYEHQREPEANHMAAFPAREFEPFMAHQQKIMATDSVITRTILLNGEVAGSIACFEMEGQTEVGYWIGRAYWGKGVATEALGQFLSVTTQRPLYAHVAKHNIGSRRVLEKCGFIICGEDTVPGETIEEFVLRLD